MAITRISVRWTGFRGAPGYSNFYFDGEFLGASAVEAAAVNIRDFFFAISDGLPSSVNIDIQPIAEVIDETSGQVTSVIDFSAPSTVSGGSSANYSAATGAVVNWNTSDYVNGRRVRGRTFLVPLAQSQYSMDGDLTSASLDMLRPAANALIAAASDLPLTVWHRPTNGAGGSSHVVSSVNVPDLGAVLRSRRD